MSGYVWSAKNISFFPKESVDDYRLSGWDLSDAIEIRDEIYNEFNSHVNGNKVIGVGKNGMPEWIDPPPPPPLTHDELVSIAVEKKALLTSEAESAIKPLERARNLGIASDDELELLTEWERYSVYLMRVDTTKPDQIVWPTKPL